MAWVWLDGMESFEKSKRARAWKKWEALFPLSYLIELTAQTGAVILGAESDYQQDIVFTKIENFEFFGRPKPQVRLEIEVEADGLRREGGWFSGRIFQEGNQLAEGRVLLMNIGRLRPDGKGPVTFPEQLQNAYIASLRAERSEAKQS